MLPPCTCRLHGRVSTTESQQHLGVLRVRISPLALNHKKLPLTSCAEVRPCTCLCSDNLTPPSPSARKPVARWSTSPIRLLQSPPATCPCPDSGSGPHQLTQRDANRSNVKFLAKKLEIQAKEAWLSPEFFQEPNQHAPEGRCGWLPSPSPLLLRAHHRVADSE